MHLWQAPAAAQGTAGWSPGMGMRFAASGSSSPAGHSAGGPGLLAELGQGPRDSVCPSARTGASSRSAAQHRQDVLLQPHCKLP